MVPLYKTAPAVCLVALYGLQSEAMEEVTKTYKFKVVEVDEDVYLAANLARNGKLPVHISEVTKDEDLLADVRKGVVDEQGVLLQGTCSEMKIKSNLEAFHHTFDYQEGPNFRELLQAALDAGLAVFKEKGYPKTDDEWQQIWANDTSAVLAHLLGSNSTKIGCVIGKCVEVTTQPPSDDQERREGSGGGEGNKTEVETDKAALFCQLSPAATKDKAPFDEDYFNGLIARTTALADMTKEDLKSAAGGGAATVALPTVLIAGLVAILTAISA